MALISFAFANHRVFMRVCCATEKSPSKYIQVKLTGNEFRYDASPGILAGVSMAGLTTAMSTTIMKIYLTFFISC
jgi:hypothetical protein